MAVVWEQSGDAFFATVEQGVKRFHLSVDELPGGGWDWAVWVQRNGWRIVRNGTASTAQEAMQEAERAAAAV
jgi:hypothetical protein